jgi:uncharacterized protein
MTAATEPGPRIPALDIVRGIAVMGILAMNIIAFAMPFQAYMNPTAFGMESAADYWSWVFSFIFIDGKMRGLFSFLFGASTLLVIERARAAGESPARVHYMRMIWLLVFGLIHFYFIWFGDILSLYALTGLLLFFFRNMSVKALMRWGVGLVILQTALFGAMTGGLVYLAQQASLPNADPELVRQWQEANAGLAALPPETLAEKLALFRGPWWGIAQEHLHEWWRPFQDAPLFMAETLAYMLFGMAALKSGLFRGEWNPGRYRKIALTGLAVAVPAYALIAWLLAREGHDVITVMGLTMAATTPFRPLMVIAYAALIILFTRNGGFLVDRIAAAGRAAFTNYLGTSLVMTTLFYGYGVGLYGSMTRIELWLPVIGMWALMLLWSKPWLERYRYGPFEWLWRSLARMRLEPMSRAQRPLAAAE